MSSPAGAIVNFTAAVLSANAVVCGFIGADMTGSNGSAAIGAISTGTMASAAPTINLVTTRNNSLVWAVANSATTATNPTAGSAQAMIRTQTDATNTAQSFMWRQNNRTATSGTTVTMNATAPTTGTGNIIAIEILPHLTYSLSTSGVG
jgi:hypothetical protein